jgi:hypothetical protein
MTTIQTAQADHNMIHEQWRTVRELNRCAHEMADDVVHRDNQTLDVLLAHLEHEVEVLRDMVSVVLAWYGNNTVKEDSA